jgi:lipoprotein-anchoring transpeptidase ErfK/SrfK
MRRPLSLHQSFILMSLGLSFWLAFQGLLPRETPPSVLGDESVRSASSEAKPSVQDSGQPGAEQTGRNSSSAVSLSSMPSSAVALNALSNEVLGRIGLWIFEGKPLQSAEGIEQTRIKLTGRVLVDLSDRQLYLYLNGDLKAKYTVAIGRAEWETPLGQYRISEMQKQPAWEHPLTGRVVPAGPDNPLGAAWIGFLAEGDYHFGLHGTLDESLMGAAVSHGCVRMRNADILALYNLVRPDWPLEVVP